MARSLERVWPGVVETKRRFQRPQHHIKNAWKCFDTPLIRKPNYDELVAESDWTMRLDQMREPESEKVRGLVKEYARDGH